MNRTLYQITQDLQALDELLAESGGDITDEQTAQAIEAYFTELDADLASKADNYAALIRTLEARAATRKDEAGRMRALAASDESNAQRLKARLKQAFEERGITKLETARFRLGVRGNGGLQSVDVSVPAETLPTIYQAVEVSPNTAAIRKALSEGVEIPGCVLMERGTHLSIK